ncbi:hypothetical protein BP6252_13865 [Coleophoma cylindrospora]|uniref:Heterokaryon incompatibility domain-containing protein n=1 Tax=Coleophoma cylindrospora TaxID=1849047 RepID=A0A3D8Q5M7_9HELO|nr:hypothetical protein BP6252_13865 [Coleophoma cylindrospora]
MPAKVSTSLVGDGAKLKLPYENFALEPSMDNSVSWETVKAWVAECKSQHSSCQEERANLRPARQLPSRLIDVGVRDDFSDIRLCHTADLQQDCQWMTLSHCWGPQGLSCKLLRTHEKKLQERVEWETLSLTFQDAVRATRNIGKAFDVRYIWIDALCIMQDSLEPGGDWDVESRKIGAIYSWSFLTLAACTGPDTTCGLFPERLRIGEHTCTFNVDNDGVRGGGKWTTYKPTALGAVLRSVLTTRAWVLQESLLSPRVLHFTPQECLWRCASVCRSESSLPEDHAEWSNQSYDYFGNPRIWNAPLNSESRVAEIHRSWQQIVRKYSSSRLTFYGDKLRAISGIAQQMKHILNNEEQFVYGLWTGKRFYTYLLWAVQYNCEPHPHSDFPTWSWISNPSKITFDHHGPEYYDWHADIDILLDKDSELDNNKDALLQIQGPLYKFSMRYEHDLEPLQLANPHGIIEGYPKLDFDLENQTDTYLLLMLNPEIVTQENSFPSLGLLMQKVEGMKGRFMSIGHFGGCRRHNPDDRSLMMAFLYPEDGSNANSQNIDLPDKFGLIQGRMKLDALEEDDYITAHNDGRYTIHLQ